ncbi:MAG TPA: hypothetical protein PLE19_07885 [Planctomycetota bacterium]|nr:hypothetical protein [Planctomycetota bacterium]HRR78897.1 hypothetical protein [Planctomycetota bacterium]HRT97839.1 hypothetical protein [Planctomycetota bacterium]
MAIKFQCECGKHLSAKDGSEGKRAKCPACGRLVTVPSSGFRLEGGEAAPAAGAARNACPGCHQELAEGAVICVQCGFDLRTGAKAGGASVLRGEKAQTTYTIPVGKLLLGAGVAAALVAGWFLAGAPLLSQARMYWAVGYVTNGDLKQALSYFEAHRDGLSPANQERADLWIRQLRLELEKNSGKTLDLGIEVKPDDVTMEVAKQGFAGGAFLAKLKITNHTKEPLTLRNDHFYVRGLSDIVLAAVHSDNSLDGVVVKPGETKEGAVAFRKVPEHGVIRGRLEGQAASAANTYYYLSFNDGTHYVKRTLPF